MSLDILDASQADLNLVIVCVAIQLLEDYAMWQLFELLGSKVQQMIGTFECPFPAD